MSGATGYTGSRTAMGFFFRRSAHIGPFRLNFSKSGIGASVGARGARLTVTPRGTTYITVGRNGFYYRETLSSHAPSRAPAPRAAVRPIATRPNDEIATADVSDLVDSSSETLIRRLNERAKLFNSAWILYALAVAVSLGVLVMFSVDSGRGLPDVGSPLIGERNTAITWDEYIALVSRYGYPDSVLATQLLSIVSVRTVRYSSVHTNVVFVPNGCVAAYDDAMRALAARSKNPALAKRQAKGVAGCTASPNNRWTIVGYSDSAKNTSISADTARILLDNARPKHSSPPIVEGESAQAPKQKPGAGGLPTKQPQPRKDVRADKFTWALPVQIQEESEAEDARTRYSKYGGLLVAFVLFVAGIFAHRRNTEKRTSRLFYELDEAQSQKYSIIREALVHLGKSHVTWRIESKSPNADLKHHAGAYFSVRRVPIRVGSSNPPHVVTNVAIPSLDLGAVKLFFLPDVVLYMEHGIFGGIGYGDFRVARDDTRFIEEDHVPADAAVVGQTWRYVNRDGGPDRRFNNNTRLPVVQYGVLVLTSSRGLNLHLQTSNEQASLLFANCWHTLHDHNGAMETSQATAPSPPQPPPGQEQQAFRVLGLSANASTGEISAAYHRLAQMYHPDKVEGLAPEFQLLADKRMKEINGAYEALGQRHLPREYP